MFCIATVNYISVISWWYWWRIENYRLATSHWWTLLQKVVINTTCHSL